MSLLPELIQPILSSPWVWILFPMFLFFYINFKVLSLHKEKPESFKNAVNYLKEDGFGQFYRNLLGKLLDSVSIWIGDSSQMRPRAIVTEQAQNYKLLPYNRFFSINPFSNESFDFLLRLAFIYPIISFLITWAVGGNASILGYEWANSEMGSVSLFSYPLSERWIELLTDLLPIVLLIPILKLTLLKQFIALITISVLAIYFKTVNEILLYWQDLIIIFLVSYIGSWVTTKILPSSDNTKKLIYNFSFVLAFSFVFSFHQAGIVAGTASAIVGLSLIVGSVGVAAFLIIISAVLYFDQNWVIMFLGVIFIFLYQIKEHTKNKPKIAVAYWFIYIITLLFIFFLSVESNDINRVIFYLFFIIFPLLNLPLDWVSLAITRGLLHSIRHKHHDGWKAFIWVALDFFLAILFLFSISAILVLTIGLVDKLSGQSFLNTALEEVSNPETAKNYYWLYAMLLTTLIPTLIHFFLAGFSLILWLPHNLRHIIVYNIEHDFYRLWLASIYLTVTPIIGIITPITLLYSLYLLIISYDNWLGSLLLEWAKYLSKIIL